MAQCPNCGDELTANLLNALTVTCESCQSTVYLLDDRLIKAGSAGVMHDAPTLLELNDQVVIEGVCYTALGHARFSYGAGWWDEYWLVPEQGDGRWLSADEGDIALQIPVDNKPDVSSSTGVIGDIIHYQSTRYTLTEIDAGECTALRGSFPEQMAVGDKFTYVNFTSIAGDLLSREVHAGSETWFEGRWIDPFELKVKAQ